MLMVVIAFFLWAFLRIVLIILQKFPIEIYWEGMVDFTGFCGILQWICMPLKIPGGNHDLDWQKEESRPSDS